MTVTTRAWDENDGAVSRDTLLRTPHILLVTRAATAAPRPMPGQPGAASDYVQDQPDIFIAVLDSGRVLAFNGHVDLGTGIRTSLGQIVAEELDVPLAAVTVILGHTTSAPNQGPTIASATIQISAIPLRRAAAQAREYLRARAAILLNVEADQLVACDAAFHVRSEPALRIAYAALVAGEHVELPLADEVRLKPASEYRIVGTTVPRVDIPAKATGALTFVHDMRLAGMLHGRVVRPPYVGLDSGDFVGNSLLSVDESSIAGIAGVVKVVIVGDFVGVVAEREEQAILAARRLKIRWRAHPALADLSALEPALRAIPSTRRPLLDTGDIAAATREAAKVLKRTYVWPFQLHASIGPSCAVADWRAEGLIVWSGTQNPHVLRIDLARLMRLDEAKIDVVRMETSGCYGRNCADDVSADAALLSHATGRPVRVQLSRQQEHQWEPKGAAQLMDVQGAIADDGSLLAYDFLTRYPSNDAPTLALLLTNTVSSAARVLQMGDRTAVPPYAYPNMRVACDDTPSIVRAAWLRGVSALPNSFAHDAFLDELAFEAGADTVEYRLRHLPDARARELISAVALRAEWVPGATGSRGTPTRDGTLIGRGVAYARYVHSKYPGFGAAWSAWVVDLEVDPATGRITIHRVVVGQDTGMVVNPDGVRHQIHGNVIQSLSRVLKEKVEFDSDGVASREWGAYPLLTFLEVPAIDIVMMDRQADAPLGAGESASVPSAAAIANALFDATGHRFREPPFTPDAVLHWLTVCNK